ncbi:SDR family NAD(P)-dependent oxidoreductase [Legionella fallonii]|uniref:Dehydrogenase with different specificities n=1 Tax=Legionella fallonii LLAP-10 TaxID=1212491 RepID=A0A098GBB6_9GAMM|nr:SDR family oxidoreductase [Legionella fallonii]CEG58766.1 Dehydrogenase with different specificities [Legionella fallonii LLAP-10]
MEFLNKKVIVTGANRSIGRKMAVTMAEQGADVVISYHNDEMGAEETINAIKAAGREAVALYADFSQMEQVLAFATQAITFLGHVDILINNAGMLCRETLLELPPEKMQRVFQVNTISPLYLLQLCANNMIERNNKGSILNISSISASMTMTKGIGYAASKAAMNKWTQNAALDLAPYGIRVNTIAPGVIEAGMNENTAASNPDLWDYYLSNIPLKRPGTPDDITNMAVFLSSEKAGWITGKIFEVDGGHAL